MDKYEIEQFEQIKELAANLQACFIDDDAYSRTPTPHEWRNAGRIVRQLTLACYELTGYAKAKRCIELDFVRQNLHVVKNETPPGTNPTAEILKITPDVGTSDDEEQGFVEFTDEEIKQMPKKLQGLIIVNKKRCRWRIHKSGKNTTTIEIRFRADGYNLSASGKTRELAKANMLKKMRAAKPKPTTSDTPTSFHSFAMFYFETFRKEAVVPQTYKSDLGRYNRYLQPYFKEIPLKRIVPNDCKKLLDPIEESGKEKTAEELYSLLNSIFKSAIAHNLIERNPIATVLKPAHESVSSIALTKEEEMILLTKSKAEPLFELAFALALYTGLRPNELATAVIEGEFIKAVNSKRHRKRNSKKRVVEYKRIYICDRLRPYLANGLPKLPSPQLLRRRISAALPGHVLKDLRKTFNSRCKELGVATPAREHFIGHAKNRLDQTYTQLSLEYLLIEGKKLNAW